jgi:TolB protein
MRRAFALAAVLLVACRDTNITAPGAGGRGRIVFASNRVGQNFEIYSIGGDGRGALRLTTDGRNDLAPVLSRDGSRIAWEREIAGPTGIESVELWVMNADGTNAHVIVSNGSENRAPSWGAGDGSLYYASFATGNWEIFRTDLATGATTNLTNQPFADQHPRVSPDGRRIVFHSNRDVQFEIYAMSADGASPTNLTNNLEDDRYPSWSPDGSRIVWSRFVDSFDLFTMGADGRDQRVVATTPYQELTGSWAPDGAALVVQTNRYPPTGLEIIAIDGTASRPLALPDAPPGSDVSPWWGR